MAKSVSEQLKFRQLRRNKGLRSALAMNVVPHFSNHGYVSGGEVR
jgi:hypothetical protein